jgi:hypothetical protein
MQRNLPARVFPLAATTPQAVIVNCPSCHAFPISIGPSGFNSIASHRRPAEAPVREMAGVMANRFRSDDGYAGIGGGRARRRIRPCRRASSYEDGQTVLAADANADFCPNARPNAGPNARARYSSATATAAIRSDARGSASHDGGLAWLARHRTELLRR